MKKAPAPAINGLQHIGLAVRNMDRCLVFYRKFLGLDIPFFDSIAPAPLMRVYTRNEVITKRASMIMNLTGGCAMEVIRPTSFEPSLPSFVVQAGDVGIFMVQVKCPDVRAAHAFCQQHAPDSTSLLSDDPVGSPSFILRDPDGNCFQFVRGNGWFTKPRMHSGGLRGAVVGVTDIERSFGLYRDMLGYNKVVYDREGVFTDWASLPGGDQRYRRVLLTQSKPPGGGFARVTGNTTIELVQALDRQPVRIFKGRIWGDSGFVHIGLDVKGMDALGGSLATSGFPFRCDSREVLDMGNTRVHCTYIDDPDGVLIEMIEVYKVPIVEKWGIYLDVEKRDPTRPLPDFMLKALRFSRIKD